MKQKFITTLLAISMISLTACGAKIEQTADNLTVELGSKLDINISDYFISDKPEVLSEFMVDTTAVNTDAVGTYNVVVGYEDERYNISVTVEDIIAPVITLNDKISEYEGLSTVNAVDLVDIEDFSECSVFFVEDGKDVESTIVSTDLKEYNLVAVDSCGNRSEVVSFEYQGVYDIFANAKDHCTFEYGPSFTLKDSTYTMDQELKTAIYDLIPELMDYPEAYQDMLLMNIARSASQNQEFDAATIRSTIENRLGEYYTYGYDKKYGPVKGVETTNNNQSTTDGNNNSGGNASIDNGNSQGTESVTYVDVPKVTIEQYEGPVTYINTGEYIDGKAVYLQEGATGNIHRYHINAQGWAEMLFDDTTGWDVIDENGAKLSEHLRE